MKGFAVAEGVKGCAVGAKGCAVGTKGSEEDAESGSTSPGSVPGVQTGNPAATRALAAAARLSLLLGGRTPSPIGGQACLPAKGC